LNRFIRFKVLTITVHEVAVHVGYSCIGITARAWTRRHLTPGYTLNNASNDQQLSDYRAVIERCSKSFSVLILPNH